MTDHRLFRESVFITLAFLGVLWCVKSWEFAASADLSFLGIYPRTLRGSLGILTAPFIHGDVQHLISNTFPLAILGVGLLFFYRKIALEVFIIVYLSTGFWVWTIARPAFHIGASGIVYGLVAFLFFIGVMKRDARSMAVSLIVIFLYHGMFAGVFPFSDRISWESHLFGGLSGLFCAIHFRNKLSPESVKDDQVLVSEPEGAPIEATGDKAETGYNDNGHKVPVPPGLLITFTNSTKGSKTDEGDIISLH